MKISLKTLSPLHIRSEDEALDAWNSCLLGGKIVRIDADRFIRERADELSRYFNQTVVEGRNFLMSDLISGDLEETSKYGLYEIGCDQWVSSFLEDAIATRKGYTIYGQIKTGRGEVYIPGSSIKGAIRTALAGLAIREDPAICDEFLSVAERTHRNALEGWEVLEKIIFDCSMAVSDRDIMHVNPNYDLMRCIRISDSSAQSPSGVLRAICFRYVQKSRGSIETRQSLRAPYFVEAIRPGASFSCELDVDVPLLRKMWEMRNDKKWGGAEKKIKRLFGVVPDDFDKDSDLVDSIVKRIFRACNMKSESILASANEFLEGVSDKKLHLDCMNALRMDTRNRAKYFCPACRRGEIQDDEVVTLKGLKEELERLEKILGMAEQNSALIKLGWGTGYQGMTVSNDIDEGVIDEILHVDAFKEDTKKVLRRVRAGNYPKTKRIYTINGRPWGEFGWIQMRAES